MAVEKAHQAAETIKDGADTALHKATAAAKQAKAEVQSKARDASATGLEALQRAKSGAAERLWHLSRRMSETASTTWSIAAEQARQAAVPVRAAALRASTATERSAQRGVAALRSVVSAAKQVARQSIFKLL